MATLSRLSVSLGADPTPLISGVNRAEKAIKSFGGNTAKMGNNLSQSFKKPQKAVQGSTMAVINFNRVIQDAPFGIMGVANNLEPLITSFQGLGTASTSTAGKLGMLLKSAFTGPGALITVVSLASSAAIAFSGKLRGAGEAGEFAKKKIEATTKAVDDLTNKFNNLAGFSLSEEVEEEIKVIDRALQFASARATAEDKLASARDRNQRAGLRGATSETKALEAQIDRYDELIKRLGFEETSLQSLNNERELAETQLTVLNNALTENQRIAKEADDIQAESAQVLAAYNAEVTGSREAIESLLLIYKQRISDLRSESSLTAGQIALINVLQGEYDDLADAIATVNEEQRQAPDKPIIGVNAPDEAKQVEESIKRTIDNIDSLKVGGGLMTVAGSMEALQDKMRTLQFWQSRVNSTEEWMAYQQSIDNVKQEMNDLRGNTEQATQSTAGLVGFANLVGSAFSRAAIEGQRLDNVLKGIITQLASKAFIIGLGSILTGGASLGGKSFLSNLFGGVFHDGGIVPGPIGSERLILAQGGEAVLTPQQQAMMTSGGGKNMNVTVTGMLRGEDIYVSGERGGINWNR